MKIPKQFRLFSSVINVVVDNKLMNDAQLYGRCDYSKRLITLCETRNLDPLSDGKKAGTFYHEKVHMILDFMEETELSKNEKFVESFSSLLRESDESVSVNQLENLPIPKSFSLFGQSYEIVLDNDRQNELHTYAQACDSQSKIFLSTTDGLKIQPQDLIVDMFYREKVYLILLAMHEHNLSKNKKFLLVFAKLWRQSNETKE